MCGAMGLRRVWESKAKTRGSSGQARCRRARQTKEGAVQGVLDDDLYGRAIKRERATMQREQDVMVEMRRDDAVGDAMGMVMVLVAGQFSLPDEWHVGSGCDTSKSFSKGRQQQQQQQQSQQQQHTSKHRFQFEDLFFILIVVLRGRKGQHSTASDGEVGSIY